MTLFLSIICSEGIVFAQIHSEDATLEWVISDVDIQNIETSLPADSGNTQWTLQEFFPEKNQPQSEISNGNITTETVHSSAPISTTLTTKTSLVTSNVDYSSPKTFGQKTILTTTSEIPIPQVSKPKTVSSPVRKSALSKQSVRKYSQPEASRSVTKNLSSTNFIRNFKGSDLVIVRPQVIKFRTRLQSWSAIEDDISTYKIALFFRQIGTGFQILFFALLGIVATVAFRDFQKIKKFIFDRIEFRVPIKIKTK